MARLNFPATPSENDTYLFGGTTWTYVDGAWQVLTSEDSGEFVTVNTTTTATSTVALDTFLTSGNNATEYTINTTRGSTSYSTKVLLNTDGTTSTITQYAELGTAHGTFTADVNTGSARLLFTPDSATSTTIDLKALRI